MARFRNKKKKMLVKTPIVKKQPSVDHLIGEKIPKSFVFSRRKVSGSLKQLELDLRKIMLLRTALRLKEKRRNTLKDFLNVAGPMGVTHFLILSKPKSVPHLQVARTPQGPALIFEIHEYALAADVVHAQTRPRCPQGILNNSPLVKLSTYQRIVLLNYNTETKLIDFRHYYSIRLQPIGISQRIRKFVQNHHVPDLQSLQDVSDFVTKAGYGLESEADEESTTVILGTDLGRVNHDSMKSAIKLQEIGSRMTLKLVKIEEGLCSGGVIFSEFDIMKQMNRPSPHRQLEAELATGMEMPDNGPKLMTMNFV